MFIYVCKLNRLKREVKEETTTSGLERKISRDGQVA
jgi:hypothetical protein